MGSRLLVSCEGSNASVPGPDAMSHNSSRRGFLQTAAAAGVPLAELHAQPAASNSPASGRKVNAFQAEIRRRAEFYSRERRLIVDYYRIRRKLAYPLPVPSLSIPPVPVPSISDYPWSIWMLWTLEERVYSLGWAAEWFGVAEYARKAAADLDALSAWPNYCQYDRPDLSSAHAGRLLWTAATKWRWVRPDLREKIRQACLRHVAEVAPKVETQYAGLDSVKDILSLPAPQNKLANIPLIGTLGAALTASVSSHPATGLLRTKIMAVFGAVLDLRERGVTEGVAYDGYILDFVADWLETLPAANRAPILNHPRFGEFLEQSYMLSAPGAIEQVAELSDVEPREMPFHISAQAKLSRIHPGPLSNWYLRRCRPAWLPSAALAALPENLPTLQAVAPRAGALNAHYACVLRSGWESGDLAVAMSANTSPMGHLQNDNATLVIGTRGQWIISDPGYQQYMDDVEREFTIGPAAHNSPVVNGHAQVRKASRLTLPPNQTGGLLRASLEIAPCYPPEAGLKSLVRNVWLQGTNTVVVADVIEGSANRTLSYHWHGHPDAAWWARDGWALVQLGATGLWFTSPQARLSSADIVRLPGSRGQLTLKSNVTADKSVAWWVFGIGDRPPVLKLDESGRSVEIGGVRFAV